MTRASPPGRAGEADRRPLYSAALQQFEELLDAAQNVSSAARPLPLYYALTQAGRAITAAHGDPFTNHGHGLGVRTIKSDLMRTCVTPTRDPKEFQAVSQIVGSPQLTGPVDGTVPHLRTVGS
jgi:hypothetical protein